MSYQGMKIAAAVFEHVQKARGELLRLGSEDMKAKSGHQDILLGQMMKTMEDSVTEEFCKLTMMKIEPPKLETKS